MRIAFEGATKKNWPDVNVGDIVLAKLRVVYKDFTETELRRFVGWSWVSWAVALKSRAPSIWHDESEAATVKMNEIYVITDENAILAAEHKTNAEINELCD